VKPLFTLGQVVATPGALAAIEKSGQQSGDFLTRHVIGYKAHKNDGQPKKFRIVD
jgi:hypothetical protein